MIKISAVIPTRNREDSLRRCIKSISRQISPPDEVIVVDSSDTRLNPTVFSEEFENLNFKYLHTTPSVCRQRNVGVALAQHDWIFLCDDDIELPANYLLTLKTYLEENCSCHVVAGRLMQLENNNWADQYPPKSRMDVVWRFVFQLSVWSDLTKVKSNSVVGFIRKWYTRRGNEVSLAGWPVLTEWGKEVTKTTIYPLGASVVSKLWLTKSPFDPVLDPHGIGDNYGVALNFPVPQSIHVLSSTYARHYLNPENRLTKAISYYRRVLALHYFIKQKENSTIRSFWFIWSLVGNFIYFIIRGESEMRKATSSAIGKIAIGRNPYWRGHLQKKENVEPNF